MTRLHRSTMRNIWRTISRRTYIYAHMYIHTYYVQRAWRVAKEREGDVFPLRYVIAPDALFAIFHCDLWLAYLHPLILHKYYMWATQKEDEIPRSRYCAAPEFIIVDNSL